MKARVALVTGGARGIGRAVVEDLLAAGWQVVAADLDAHRLTAHRHARLHTEVVDVRDEVQVRSAIEATSARHGRLDLLVNVAGISSPHAGPVEALALETWRDFLDTNLTGAFLCVKHAAPLLRQARGTIVNVASTRASMSEPNTEAYAASKGGLVALTHALAVSLGPQVAVHAVSPGWIDTRRFDPRSESEPEPLSDRAHAQHPAGRVGRPEDVSALVRFLAEEPARFMTGQEHVIDGGMSRKMIYEG